MPLQRKSKKSSKNRSSSLLSKILPVILLVLLLPITIVYLQQKQDTQQYAQYYPVPTFTCLGCTPPDVKKVDNGYKGNVQEKQQKCDGQDKQQNDQKRGFFDGLFGDKQANRDQQKNEKCLKGGQHDASQKQPAPTKVPAKHVTPTEAPHASAPATQSAPIPKASACSSALSKHVYGWGTRVKVLESCRSVRGTVTGVSSITDGDIHMSITVDQAYQAQVGNRSKILAEIICHHPATSAAAKKSCAGYTNTIQAPKNGDYIEVVGPYVQDSHGYYEIHPINSLKQLKK